MIYFSLKLYPLGLSSSPLFPPSGRPFEAGLLKAGALSKSCCSCVAGGEIRGFYDMVELVGLCEPGASGSQTLGLKDRSGVVP